MFSTVLLLNHIKDAYNLKYHLWVQSNLNILIPCFQSLQPLLLFFLYLCSFTCQICSFKTILKTDCVQFRDAVMSCHLLTNCETNLPSISSFSESIDHSIDLFIMCLLFWTCNRMCLLFLVSLGLLQTQAIKAGSIPIVKSTLQILFCDQ